MSTLEVSANGIIAYPHHWQLPAQTEKAAYEAVMANTGRCSFEYVGFPWATVIDGLRGRSRVVPEILVALSQVPAVSGASRRRLTVAQHIHALQFAQLYKAAGVTDVYWSHATHDQLEYRGLRIHPFPLFPAQTPLDVPPEQPVKTRKFLANFIGAYNPNVYLTNVRECIFQDAGRTADVLIIKRNAWHFHRAVYDQQITGLKPDASRLQVEREQAEEYLDAIRGSWFTLCPSGSGPSSIRIFESLCLGSIPIVLTRSLRLAGPQDLWERAALIEDDSVEGYRRAVQQARAMPAEKRRQMLLAGRQLYASVAPPGYFSLLNSKECAG